MSKTTNNGNVASKDAKQTTKLDKDAFLDKVYWARQVAALFCGLLWGYFEVTGAFGLLSFAAVNTIFVYFFSTQYHSCDEHLSDAVKEGFMSALSVFMVSWITSYSAAYF